MKGLVKKLQLAGIFRGRLSHNQGTFLLWYDDPRQISGHADLFRVAYSRHLGSGSKVALSTK